MNILKKTISKLIYNRDDEARKRLVLRNWGGISDINVLAEALKVESFRSYIKPSQVELKEGQKILVLAPHQDDELIGCGGLLVNASKKSNHITISYITNGAQNNVKLGGKKISCGEISQIRKDEAKKVCKKLNATYHDLDIDNISMSITNEHITAFANLLKTNKFDLILLPWLFDGSAKHRAVSHLLYLSLKEANLSSEIEIWGYQVNNPIFSNLVLDITPHLKEKLELLDIYRSQNTGIKNYAHMSEGLSAWNSRFLPSKKSLGKKQYAEIYMSLHLGEFIKFIEKYYLSDIKATYFGKKSIYQNFL